jgi:hypothetical protein
MFKTILTFVLMTYAFSGYALELGHYHLKVTINNRFFEDELIISKKLPSNQFEGQFIVPNVFDVEFKGKTSVDENGIESLTGSFTAQENGGSFVVDLEAKVLNLCELEGSLFQGKSKFADFTGKREKCHE